MLHSMAAPCSDPVHLVESGGHVVRACGVNVSLCCLDLGMAQEPYQHEWARLTGGLAREGAAQKTRLDGEHPQIGQSLRERWNVWAGFDEECLDPR